MLPDTGEWRLISWIGARDFGAVDRLEGEGVVTAFWTVVIPLWPSQSFYIAGDQRIGIGLQPRSVVLGYLRAPLWLAALLCGAPALVDPSRWGGLLALGIALALLASISTFRAGRLEPAERARRSLLRRVVGFGAPPELLPAGLRDHLAHDLEARWLAESRTPWIRAIALGASSELLVALADYHQLPALVAQAIANMDDPNLN